MGGVRSRESASRVTLQTDETNRSQDCHVVPYGKNVIIDSEVNIRSDPRVCYGVAGVNGSQQQVSLSSEVDRMIRKLFALAAIVACTSLALAAEIKSGPQNGEKVPGPFFPLNVNGENAGKKACLYCKHGDSPVAVVFARTATCEQASKLIEKLDAETGKNTKAEMGFYVVFLSDDDKLEAGLKKMIEEKKLKNVTLSIESPKGPEKYALDKDADVTVLLYNKHKVESNFAFAKGKLTDKDIDTIVGDVSKIVK